VHGLDIDQALEELASGYFQAANKKEKIAFAVAISEAVSQRKASKLTGVSRDTIRTRLNAGAHEEGHEG
jgi:transposase